MGSKALIIALSSLLIVILWALEKPPAQALPPPEDIPEEQLRLEIITAARSPIDNQPLTAAEYAQLQTQLQQGPAPEVPAQLRQLLFLLQLRRTLRTIIPFNF